MPNAGDLVPFDVALPGATGTGTVTIELFATFDQDHEITVAVNGTGYGTFTWSGVDYKRITIDNVPLLDGNNTVALACSSGEDTVLLDWIEVDYARNFAADGNQLKFAHADGYRYTVSDLIGSAVDGGSNWIANVTITIMDEGGNPVAYATVSGSWSRGLNSTSSCMTDATGQCVVKQIEITNNTRRVTFSIDEVSHATLAHNPALDVVSSIRVDRP